MSMGVENVINSVSLNLNIKYPVAYNTSKYFVFD